MRVDYLSLTEAINIFETRRIEYIQYDIPKLIKEEEGNPGYFIQKKILELSDYIKNGNIALYGKKKGNKNYLQNPPFSKVTKDITEALTDIETFSIYGNGRFILHSEIILIGNSIIQYSILAILILANNTSSQSPLIFIPDIITVLSSNVKILISLASIYSVISTCILEFFISSIQYSVVFYPEENKRRREMLNQ